MVNTVDFAIDMTVDVDGETIVVAGDQDEVLVDIPTFRSARRIFRQSKQILKTATDKITAIPLRSSSLRISIRVRGRTVASSGVGLQPNWVARLMRLKSTRLHPLQILCSLLADFGK
jgi:hypothetical protein